MATPVKGSLPATTRDDWFDCLARGVAGSMSRRDAIGLFAGTTAMAILASWVRPSRAFGAGPSAGNDPGCGGARTFYKAGCAKPVEKLPPYKPAINGCGPQNGVNLVPQSPLYLASFTPACDEHDRGYGTCNRPKEVTDLKFLADMKAICVKEYPVAGLFSAMGLVQCTRNAETYYTAVSLLKLGYDAYADGQAEGCDCCDECPGGKAKCFAPKDESESPLQRTYREMGICCPKDKICENGHCCYPCDPGWTKCPNVLGAPCFGCCNPATPTCYPGKTKTAVFCR